MEHNNLTILLFQTSTLTEIGTIVGIIGGVLGSLIGVYATLKANRLKTETVQMETQLKNETAQLEIKAKSFEVETLAQQQIAATEITATQTLLESWKEQSKGQATRIDAIEEDLKHCTESHNQCEVKCAKLEGKIEMLSTLQGVTSGRVSTQSDRQDLQEERQNTQEERQNFLETKTIISGEPVVDGKLNVSKVNIKADSVEVENDGEKK